MNAIRKGVDMENDFYISLYVTTFQTLDPIMSIVEQHAQSMLAPAKGWKPPKIVLPDLPAEMCMVIFREATWVPRILDPDSTGGFGSLTSRRRLGLLRASLVCTRDNVPCMRTEAR
jgi:hypothetical protein